MTDRTMSDGDYGYNPADYPACREDRYAGEWFPDELELDEPCMPTRDVRRPRLLDAFCGAGGCAVGYHRAGFDVVGVDIKPQPRYPYAFHQGDALEFIREHGHEFDVIHCSPPCHFYSTATSRNRRAVHREHADLVPATREALVAAGKPWVIENVVGAPLRDPIMLCGSSFGLDLQRHRLFESNVLLLGLPCDHSWQTPRFRSLDSRRAGKLARVIGVHGSLNYRGELELRQKAMGIDWMPNKELTQAIPPAYTFFVGTQLMEHINANLRSSGVPTSVLRPRSLPLALSAMDSAR